MCPNGPPLDILHDPHLAHSPPNAQDVGWLKTVDQYATGGNNSIQHANTGLTIGSVLQNLRDNADRTFSYVEQAFFQRWVQDADDDQLSDMRAAVASGQMVFLNGAWAMHDGKGRFANIALTARNLDPNPQPTPPTQPYSP